MTAARFDLDRQPVAAAVDRCDVAHIRMSCPAGATSTRTGPLGALDRRYRWCLDCSRPVVLLLDAWRQRPGRPGRAATLVAIQLRHPLTDPPTRWLVTAVASCRHVWLHELVGAGLYVPTPDVSAWLTTAARLDHLELRLGWTLAPRPLPDVDVDVVFATARALWGRGDGLDDVGEVADAAIALART